MTKRSSVKIEIVIVVAEDWFITDESMEGVTIMVLLPNEDVEPTIRDTLNRITKVGFIPYKMAQPQLLRFPIADIMVILELHNHYFIDDLIDILLVREDANSTITVFHRFTQIVVNVIIADVIKEKDFVHVLHPPLSRSF